MIKLCIAQCLNSPVGLLVIVRCPLHIFLIDAILKFIYNIHIHQIKINRPKIYINHNSQENHNIWTNKNCLMPNMNNTKC